MKKWIVFIVTLSLTILQVVAQPAPDEEKIKKAVALLNKMTSNPDQAMVVYQELEALKLSKAERKEAENRMQQQLMQNAGMSDAMQQKATGKITREEAETMKKEMAGKQAASLSEKTGMDS